MIKWSKLDVGGKRVGLYTHELLSRYRLLKHNIEKYSKAGLQLPTMLKAQLLTFITLEKSLRKQGLIK